MTNPRGNDRLIYLHKLTRDEIRAIRHWGKEELGELPIVYERWAYILAVAGKHAVPVERAWIENPHGFYEDLYPPGLEKMPLNRAVKSRGFCPENCYLGSYSSLLTHLLPLERAYTREFGSCPCQPMTILSLDELDITVDDGPLQPEVKHPAVNPPEQMVTDLQQAKDLLYAALDSVEPALARKIDTFLGSLRYFGESTRKGGA